MRTLLFLAASGLLVQQAAKYMNQSRMKKSTLENKMDQTLEDSFPASDAPGWTAPIRKTA